MAGYAHFGAGYAQIAVELRPDTLRVGPDTLKQVAGYAHIWPDTLTRIEHSEWPDTLTNQNIYFSSVSPAWGAYLSVSSSAGYAHFGRPG